MLASIFGEKLFDVFCRLVIHHVGELWLEPF
jgi:hypothetical protein